MKDMKLGTKIALGFGILIFIACVLGGIAVWNMKHAGKQSSILAYEYVPEVDVASELRGAANRVMYEMRGYGFTENDAFYGQAQNEIKAVKQAIADGQVLEEKATHLEKLKGQLEVATQAVDRYERLMEETRRVVGLLAKDRAMMDEKAGILTNNFNAFLESQIGAFTDEIDSGASTGKLHERAKKNNLFRDLIRLTNNVRVTNFKAQALREPKVLEEAIEEFEGRGHYVSELEAITREAEDIRNLENIQKAANAYEHAMEDFLANWKTLQALGQQRDQAGGKVLEACTTTADAGLTRTDEIATQAAASLETASWIMISGLLIAVITGISVAVFITRGITKPVNRIVSELSDGADQVASASGQVSSASQSLAEGSAEQAASLEETSSSLEEMSSMTKQNAGNANEADNLMKEANQVVTKANGSMTDLITSMQEISKASEETSKIIKTIDEIAFQTNLLALNAAVEAARAGEAGAGFAVVADEVRNLAMRAADAAKNTADLIEGTVKKVKDGSDLVTSTNEAFQEVAQNATKVGELVGEISAASNEQAQGIEQVNKAVSEMDKVVQGAAANAEESASAAEEMNAQAEQMRSIVNELSAMVNRCAQAAQQQNTNAVAKNGNGTGKKLAGLSARLPLGKKRQKEAGSKHLAVGNPKSANPEDVIPMRDEENDFRDF